MRRPCLLPLSLVPSQEAVIRRTGQVTADGVAAATSSVFAGASLPVVMRMRHENTHPVQQGIRWLIDFPAPPTD
jgi:hypothetical protein